MKIDPKKIDKSTKVLPPLLTNNASALNLKPIGGGGGGLSGLGQYQNNSKKLFIKMFEFVIMRIFIY